MRFPLLFLQKQNSLKEQGLVFRDVNYFCGWRRTTTIQIRSLAMAEMIQMVLDLQVWVNHLHHVIMVQLSHLSFNNRMQTISHYWLHTSCSGNRIKNNYYEKNCSIWYNGSHD